MADGGVESKQLVVKAAVLAVKPAQMLMGDHRRSPQRRV